MEHESLFSFSNPEFWVLAALVGVAQLGAEHANPLGILKLHRLQQQARQHRRAHLHRY